MNSQRTRIIVLLVLSLALFVYVAPGVVNRGIAWIDGKIGISLPRVPASDFHLGLDLVGGAHLLYQADLSQISGIDPDDAMEGIRDVIERRVNAFGVAEPLVQVSGSDRLIVELAGITDINQAIRLIGETPFLEFKESIPLPSTGPNNLPLDQSQINDTFVATGLNGRHLARAQVIFDPNTGRPLVSLNLNAEGTKLFAEITKRNLGKIVAIYLDGQIISAPVVESEIPNGEAVISGVFTPAEAKTLATRLNSGALPVPISLISQQTVGASLGAVSLAQSLRAGLFGFLFVALFMILFYRVPGVMAVLALGVYTLIVLALYKAIPVTLTLAGIAGFILSIGIAVDANVLIFARMREELAQGKALSLALTEGFSRAWLSIRDGHMTTLIGAGVLYGFTSSVVKGFALTLGLGVLTSLFTATIVTQAFLRGVANTRLGKIRWLFS